MRFAVDVAYLDREWRVLSVRTMPPGRIGVPRPRARHVVEAAAGSPAEWGVRGVRGSSCTARDDGSRCRAAPSTARHRTRSFAHAN
jgi:uncharacterized membrane protein (UPF0127 family)